jgi:hypothetical protein
MPRGVGIPRWPLESPLRRVQHNSPARAKNSISATDDATAHYLSGAACALLHAGQLQHFAVQRVVLL